jgi:hypothetical protein
VRDLHHDVRRLRQDAVQEGECVLASIIPTQAGPEMDEDRNTPCVRGAEHEAHFLDVRRIQKVDARIADVELEPL